MIKNIYKKIIEKKLVFKKYHLEQSFKQTRRLPNPLSFSWFKSIVIIFFFAVGISQFYKKSKSQIHEMQLVHLKTKPQTFFNFFVSIN